MFFGSPPVVQNAVARRGNTTRTRKLLLDQTAYVTGGWDLSPTDTGLSLVFDAYLLAHHDPMMNLVPAPQAFPVLLTNPDGTIKLKLYRSGSEAANGWTGSAGAYVWITFVGTG